MKTYAAIPIANIWLLMLYASDLNLNQTRQAILLLESKYLSEGLTAWFTDLLQQYLQNPNNGYVQQQQALTHIRGQVDLKQTYQRQSLKQGKVYCRYAEVSLNHQQHQYLYLAVSTVVKHSQAGLRSRLLHSQKQLEQMGVSVPNQQQRYDAPSQTQFGHGQKQLQQLLILAKLLLEFQIPSTDQGKHLLQQPNTQDVHWLRRLFEKAIAGFYKKYLDRKWQVVHGAVLKWPQDAQHAALPQMKSDIILKHSNGHCILIDTKFTHIFEQGYYRKRDLFKNQHIYQLYTYLRSQEYPESRFKFNQGILLYPSIAQDVQVDIQLHDYPIGFYSVDLTQAPLQIERQLLGFINAAVRTDCAHIS
jgi:5-methylcytosine-specific restriction enzyme subunit McrC